MSQKKAALIRLAAAAVSALISSGISVGLSFLIRAGVWGSVGKVLFTVVLVLILIFLTSAIMWIFEELGNLVEAVLDERKTKKN